MVLPKSPFNLCEECNVNNNVAQNTEIFWQHHLILCYCSDIPRRYYICWSLAVTLRTARFNIQKCYMLLTLRLCVLYGSRKNQRRLPYTTLRVWFCITEVESVYSAVRTESLYNWHVSTLKG
jgi:hypothetical protein